MNQQHRAREVFAYYWKQLKAYPISSAGILISLPITILLNTYLPALVLANVLSRLSQHNYQTNHLWASFGGSLMLYIILLFSGLFMWRVVDYITWLLEAKVNKRMIEEVLDHLLSESTDFHANHFTGSLVSKTNKLLGGYVRTADTTIFQVYPMLAGILISVIILAPRSPLFVILLLGFSISFIALSFRISRPVRYHSSQTAAAESRQTGYLADAITNVVAIKSFSRSKYEHRRFQKATKDTHDSLLRFAKAHKRQMNSLGVLSRSMSIFALFMAVISVMTFHVNIATVFLIFSYTSGIADQLFSFGNNSLRNYNRSVGDAYDMVAILSEIPAVQDPPNPEAPRIKLGKIEFKEVYFGHEENTNTSSRLFKNFNLKIEPGEKIGLVGHSGGGKTTLTKLILRFMDIDKGMITIDGQNIASITHLSSTSKCNTLRQSECYEVQTTVN